MRKSLAVLLTVSALTLVSACGASGGSDSATKDKATTTTEKAKVTTTTEAKSDAVPVDEWAASFCKSFGAWTTTIKSTGDDISKDITPGDLAGARTAIVALFDKVSAETKDLITTLETSGTPDIDDGEQFVKDLSEKFQGFVDATEASKAKAAAIPVDDPTTFQTQFTAVFDDFQKNINAVGDSFGELDTKYPDSDLQAALSKSCDL